MAIAGAVPTELGDKRIRDLLMQYAVPAIIAMTASSLYNMVDSIYIGHIKDVGSYAISGLAVTFPLMNLATALGTLVASALPRFCQCFWDRETIKPPIKCF